jgi:hypothetical protein
MQVSTAGSDRIIPSYRSITFCAVFLALGRPRRRPGALDSRPQESCQREPRYSRGLI